MTDPTEPSAAVDYSRTLFLPQTDFPMRAGLPEREPLLIARWAETDLYGRLRQAGQGRARFVLHDGPPYANGNIHIGHALNKVLKDLVVRAQQMQGFDAPYVPGWDCHGLPIEWRIEEEYRAKGRAKPELNSGAAINAFRAECRAYAEQWLATQREEFKRLGVTGDWERPYSTMAYPAEAQIAREILKFKDNGLLYRGSKPVMWSVVEKTALAEAEIEYHDYVSDQVWVKFPVKDYGGIEPLRGASIVIWTTTPWTLPGNRAIAYSSRSNYIILAIQDTQDSRVLPVREEDLSDEEKNAFEGNDPREYARDLSDILAARRAIKDNCGDVRFVIIDNHERIRELKERLFKRAGVVFDGGIANKVFEIIERIGGSTLGRVTCSHPLAHLGYDFDVPLLDGDHVTDDAGTGFVHTAPGHGRDDYEIWTSRNTKEMLEERDIPTAIPFTVDDDGFYTKEAPGFEGKRVLTDTGEKGDANKAVIEALIGADMLVARDRLKHQYPHSWRSKKPVIFRNTPQWFIAMDKPFRPTDPNLKSAENSAVVESMNNTTTLRRLAFKAIEKTTWVPETGRNRIRGMVENKPDWVMSRQRAWGVPIPVFVHRDSGALLRDEAVDDAIAAAFEQEGADAWFADGAKERFLRGAVHEGRPVDPAEWEQVTDVLDVWFDSGSTHAYTLGDPRHFPVYDGLRRTVEGGRDVVMYLEGSDQHRGWFQSSLLESCGTRGRAPFDVVLTHGFVLDEKGEKMSKSKGNVTAPQDVIRQSGADILRLWVAASDYADDLRIGPEIVKTFSEHYRKLRNTIRWMLGSLAHRGTAPALDLTDPATVAGLPELEQLILHRLAGLGEEVRKAYAAFDYKRVVASLTHFMTADLSAFHFDIRKDALYCDPLSSARRAAALAVIEATFRRCAVWLAPILVFTAEEAWLEAYPEGKAAGGSVHLETFPDTPGCWLNAPLAAKWEAIREVRRVVTGALEIERAQKRIGSSLEAAPILFVADAALRDLLHSVDLAEIGITSRVELVAGDGPAEAFRLEEVKGVAVLPRRAADLGLVKCARSWAYFDPATADPAFPEVSPRDAAALREWQAAHGALPLAASAA